MALIQWDEIFTTGIAQVDADHRHLFDLINQVHEAFATQDLMQVGAVLDQLVDYSCYHFTTEEAWMWSVGYPKVTEHMRQHDGFARRVTEMQRNYAAGKTAALTSEVLTFVRNWWVTHILESDGKFRRFVDAANEGLAAGPLSSGNGGGPHPDVA